MNKTGDLRVAVLQLSSPRDESSRARIDRVLPACAAAARRADLVLLPELWATGYFAFDRYEAEASAMDGPLVAELRALARTSGSYLMGGSFLERSKEGIHNTAVLIDGAGEVVLRYRKCHLFGLGNSRESQLLVAGDEAPVVETEFGAVGVMTCYDLRFPELARSLMDRGAKFILVAAAWPTVRVEHWRILLRARALENQLFVIACNASGDAGGAAAAGHSTAVDPWGQTIFELGGDPDTHVVSIDPAAVDAARADFPVLEDRRILTSVPRGR